MLCCLPASNDKQLLLTKCQTVTSLLRHNFYRLYIQYSKYEWFCWTCIEAHIQIELVLGFFTSWTGCTLFNVWHFQTVPDRLSLHRSQGLYRLLVHTVVQLFRPLPSVVLGWKPHLPETQMSCACVVAYIRAFTLNQNHVDIMHFRVCRKTYKTQKAAKMIIVVDYVCQICLWAFRLSPHQLTLYLTNSSVMTGTGTSALRVGRSSALSFSAHCLHTPGLTSCHSPSWPVCQILRPLMELASHARHLNCEQTRDCEWTYHIAELISGPGQSVAPSIFVPLCVYIDGSVLGRCFDSISSVGTFHPRSGQTSNPTSFVLQMQSRPVFHPHSLFLWLHALSPGILWLLVFLWAERMT